MTQKMLDYCNNKLNQLEAERVILAAQVSLNAGQFAVVREMLNEIKSGDNTVPEGPFVPKKAVVLKPIKPESLSEAILCVLYECRQIGQSQMKSTMNTKEITAAIPATGYTGSTKNNKVSSKLWELANAKRIVKHSHTKPITYSHKQ